MLVTVTHSSIGVYLGFNSMDIAGKTGIFLAAKATTASGDVLEALSLAILDFIVKYRSVTAVLSLTPAAVLRCFGTVFANAGQWSNCGVMLEIIGEGAYVSAVGGFC